MELTLYRNKKTRRVYTVIDMNALDCTNSRDGLEVVVYGPTPLDHLAWVWPGGLNPGGHHESLQEFLGLDDTTFAAWNETGEGPAFKRVCVREKEEFLEKFEPLEL